MQSFVNSMSNKGIEHTRIDDIDDAEKLQLEDEEGHKASSGSAEEDSEAEAVFEAEEKRLIRETNSATVSNSDSDGEDEDDDDDDDDDVSSDEEETPRRSFQARLTQVRQSAKAKGKMRETAFSAAQASDGDLFAGRLSTLRERGNNRQECESDEDDDESDDFDADFTWADKDEDYLADLQVIAVSARLEESY